MTIYQTPPDWRDTALCPEVDSELFFPEKGESSRDAKQVCGQCEVVAECLEYALQTEQKYGIWGGLSVKERRRLVRIADTDLLED